MIEQDALNQEVMGEVYDDPFEGMEQMFEEMEDLGNVLNRNKETDGDAGSENVKAMELDGDQDQVKVEMANDDLEKKKAELLTKIKSFGLPTAPVDNLLGPAKENISKESRNNMDTKANKENLKENAIRAPVKESEARVEEGKGQFIIKDSKETNGATKDTVTVSRGDIKRRVKRTKAINPLVGRQKKKISNAKKAL